MLAAIWKPWFVYRPSQLVRRAWFAVGKERKGLRPLPTSWGESLLADSSRVVGASIAMTGVFDLAVTETLVRLVDAGNTVVDAGANIGYMATLLARATGSNGRLYAFEPHPELFAILERNIAGARLASDAVRLFPLALGTEPGAGFLVVPEQFSGNDGLSHMRRSAADGETGLDVSVETLDRVLGESYVHMLKLDVEGYELEVLNGARRLLRERRIRHIIFEEHAAGQSAVIDMLRSAGYTIYALGWSLRGPDLHPATSAAAHAYEAPSFLATLDPAEAVHRMRPRGWLSLSPLSPRQRQGQQP